MNLPIDINTDEVCVIIRLILELLDVKDIISFMMTEKSMKRVVDSVITWKVLLKRDYNLNSSDKGKYITHHYKCMLLNRLQDYSYLPTRLTFKEIRTFLRNSEITTLGNRKTDEAILNSDILGIYDKSAEILGKSLSEFIGNVTDVAKFFTRNAIFKTMEPMLETKSTLLTYLILWLIVIEAKPSILNEIRFLDIIELDNSQILLWLMYKLKLPIPNPPKNLCMAQELDLKFRTLYNEFFSDTEKSSKAGELLNSN